MAASMAHSKWISFALCLGVVLTLSVRVAATELEGFEEDVIPSTRNPQDNKKAQSPDYQETVPLQEPQSPQKDAANTTPKPAAPPVKKRIWHRMFGYYELAGLVLLVWYGVNIRLGQKKNEAIALSWAQEFCKDGSVLERNFALLGPGGGEQGEVLWKESSSSFRFYASGRRYCTGMLVELELRKRQDLMTLISYFLMPREDRIDIEVAMAETAMPPMVLAIAPPKVAKEMHKTLKDVGTFARKVDVTRDRIRDWPSQQLSVYAEQASVFYDIMTDGLVELAFGTTAFQPLAKYFRFLHFTSEDIEGTHRHSLHFSFNLPKTEDMEALTPWMLSVTKFIDVIGAYKLSPEQQKKAETLRQDVEKAAFNETVEQRREKMQEKKTKAMLDEKEKLKRMTPAAREKYERQKARLNQRRAMRQRTIKV